MLLSLTNKNVLITGASSGLGAHFATTLSKAGASKIALAARRTDRLQSIASQLLRNNNQTTTISTVKMDISSPDSIRQALKSLEQEWNGETIDVLINNAGISIPGLFLKSSVEDFDTLINTNLRGMWIVTQEVAKNMIKHNKKGSIVNIASILGLRVQTGLSTYAITKSAVIQQTKAIAWELIPNQIRVNAIAPGYIKTEMNSEFFDSEKGKATIQKMPAKRLGLPHELDGALLLLASDAGSFMTGSVITVDGGHLISSL
jgi:NAD(P)-dependent dehydrogenase (short-subunit alcohol dehydrogenase family)